VALAAQCKAQQHRWCLLVPEQEQQMKEQQQQQELHHYHYLMRRLWPLVLRLIGLRSH